MTRTISRITANARLLLAMLLAAVVVGVPAAAGPAEGHAKVPAIAGHTMLADYPAIGLDPADLRGIYGVDRIDADGTGVTVAVVGAFDAPRIEKDLATYSKAFDLPACTKANGCLRVVYADGHRPRARGGDWAREAALDVEMVHAIAPGAKIVLVEAPDDYNLDLAVRKTVSLKPHVVTMSWGGPEDGDTRYFESLFARRDIAFFAATGDAGHEVNWPAVATRVVAVGGTSLADDATWETRHDTETAWDGSGGGTSAYLKEPVWQKARPGTRRSVPDVAAVGGTAISAFLDGQWLSVDGTSASSPIWAGIAAVAAQMRGGRLVDVPKMLEALPADAFFDITEGTNGDCGKACTARAGYDLVTGRGSPHAQRVIQGIVAHPDAPVDTDSPTVSIDGLPRFGLFAQPVADRAITVTIVDASPVTVATVELRDEAGSVVWSSDLSATCAMGCATIVTVALVGRPDGRYWISVRAVDAGRNVGASDALAKLWTHP
ncbi:MAG: S53 family peptidase [Chloroflexota bacterium]